MKFFNLAEDQKAQLSDWLLQGMTFRQARERVAQEFGVRVESDGAVGEFWEKVCVPELVTRGERAAETARVIVRQARRSALKLDVGAAEVLRQKLFELAVSSSEPKAIKDAFSMVMESKRVELSRKRLRLAWERQNFDAAKKCMKAYPTVKAIAAKSDLTEKEKIDAIRMKLFGKVVGNKDADGADEGGLTQRH